MQGDICIFISTHTLTWSVTFLLLSIVPKLFNFNSHAHVERDLTNFSSLAPAVYFNSHAHVERDLTNFSSLAPAVYFNSHAHVERDE